MRHRDRCCIALLAQLLLLLLLASCGGGSSSTGIPPTAPGFSISASPQSQAVNVGQTATVSLSVIATGGFSQTISVIVTDLPTGVIATPASPFSITTSGQQITLTASASAPLGTTTIGFTGTSGNLTSFASETLKVSPVPPGLPNNRTSFVRTDDTPLAIVYDPVHQLIFASALHLNCVQVISPLSQQVIKSIPVPAPVGLSFSTNGTQILVGTQLGRVAWIDTASQQVVQWDTVPQLPQNPGFVGGFNYPSPLQVFQAANGKIFLFPAFGVPAVSPEYTPPASVAEWDPSSGTTKIRADAGSGDAVSISADHTKILMAGEGTAAIYDSGTDHFTAISAVQNEFATINPTGSQFAVLGGNPLVTFYNLQLQQTGSVGVSDCCAINTVQPTAVYSADDTRLYVSYIAQSTGLPKLITIDANSFQILGATANLSTELAGFGIVTSGSPRAVDSTGLVFEMADHGVGVVDAPDFQSFQNPQVVADFIGATPDEGPLNTATTTNLTTATFAALPDVFFGSQRGLNPALTSGQTGQLSATAPPSSTLGPVNVKAVEANGVMAFMPQAFSYGSVPIQFGELASDPKGGVLADLFGYGYSVDIPGAAIQVSIGSSGATVNSKDVFPAGYPFPLQHLVVAVPAGSAGAVDLKVTSPTGTATSSKAFHYVKSVTSYSSPDSFLYMLYDSHRNQLYLSAGDHIDVFSSASNSFTTPITIPSNGGSRSILGLALTPDGSRLLAANLGDQSVAIVNPDSPSSGATAVTVPPSPAAGNPGPFQIATTSTNQAFVTLTGGTGQAASGGPIYSIDLSSFQITSPILPAGSFVQGGGLLEGSADGSVIMEATEGISDGELLSWNAASNVWYIHLVEGQFWSDATISGDGNVLALSSDPDVSDFPFPYLLDAQLNLSAQVNFTDFQSSDEGPTLQFDQSGALLYAVNGAGVDIFDARTGQLRERVLLSEQILSGPVQILQTPEKTMVISPAGDQIFLLTTAGLTVVDLDDVPLGIGSVTPASAPTEGVVTVRGTGFVSGTSVAVNGASAVVSFVDASTLTVTIPSAVKAGPAQLTVTNPDNSQFMLDAAFQVQ